MRTDTKTCSNETASPKIGHRIAVVGVCGSGKTTLAKRIAEKLDMTYICNDVIIWGPNWTPVPRDVRIAETEQAMSAEKWTYDGNFGRRADALDQIILNRIDTIIWLDFSRFSSYRQLFLRTIRRAWTKEELWHGNTESWYMSFCTKDSILWWALKTYSIRKKLYGEFFNDAKLSHIKRIKFTSPKEVNVWIESI